VTDSIGSAAEAGHGRWTVPGYTEVRVLGGGGFGEVVLATHDASGNPVAIKYLHPDLLGDPEQAAAFAAEARTLAGLDSPHVVRLYEYVAGPAGAAIVMEFVEGATLAAMLERHGKTTPEAALVVLFGSLLGLAAAHARGVVHRDYKPANVLVNGQGASKLTDFGIAALAGGRPVPAGTLRYMPPEQFEGGQASPAGDVYAATVTFYECLTGHVPFAGRTAQELYDQHKSVQAPLDEVPEPVRPIIARGMAKSPGDRMSDAAGLAAELRKVAVGGYGEDWAERGRSHLAEAAALLLALLWPSGSAPAAQGGSVVHTPLSEPANEPASSAGHAGTGQSQPSHPQLNQNETGQSQPGHAQLNQHNPQSGHALNQHQLGQDHLTHLEHLAHEHAEHLEHVEHVEHLGQPARAVPGRSGSGSHAAEGADSAEVTASTGTATTVSPLAARLQHLVRNASRSSRLPRWLRRALPNDPSPGTAMAIAAVATAAVVVLVVAIAAIAAALTSGSPAPQAGFTNASVVGTYTFSRQAASCVPSGSCTLTPLVINIDCPAGGSCVASTPDGEWGASHELAVTGNTMSFSGYDPGAVTCNGTDSGANIALTLTVTSWSAGQDAVRTPEQIQGVYSLSYTSTPTCPGSGSAREILTLTSE